jgi:hypothetical protein
MSYGVRMKGWDELDNIITIPQANDVGKETTVEWFAPPEDLCGRLGDELDNTILPQTIDTSEELADKLLVRVVPSLRKNSIL